MSKLDTGWITEFVFNCPDQYKSSEVCVKGYDLIMIPGGEATVQAMTNGDLHHGSGVGVASRHHRGSGSVEFSGTSCAGCGKRIVDRFLLKALDMFWHEDCLKCGCCDCRLGEVGSTLYTKANLILCKRDYLRYFLWAEKLAQNCQISFTAQHISHTTLLHPWVEAS